MGTINFYLKKAEESTGRSLIYLQFKYRGKKLVYSFGQTIDKKNWNANKQRVKNNRQTSGEGDHILNDLLDGLEEICETSYKAELKNGVPTADKLRGYLTAFVNRNNGKDPDGPNLFKLIDRFIAGEIKNKGRVKSKGTLNNYRAVKKHLQDFQVKSRSKVDFDSVSLDFFYKYTTFLKDQAELSNNTIAKDIRILKVFMGEAVDLGYTNNNQFRHKKFSYEEDETDAVYLTDKEIHRLFNHKFENKKLDQVKDLFVFGCCVGLRFSDYAHVKPENIVKVDGEDFIKIITQKTGELVIIPTNPIVLEIFEKYKENHNRLPRSISNQKFNNYIKDACKEAGLEEKGRLSTAPKLELWQSISSHTCRRSFATNLYLEGFPVLEIMKVTGHKTEKAFYKYIRHSKLDSAMRLNAHIKTMWSKKLLKVAG